MRKKTLLIIMSIWAAIFLVACGENVETNEEVRDDNIATEETNTEEIENDNENLTEEEQRINEQNEGQEEANEFNSVNKDVEEKLTVHFIDVGQADATLIEFEGEEEQYRILYDAGNWNRNDVISYLQMYDVDYIDILIGSHIHSDHIGQMDKVIENVDVGEVWMTGEVGTSQTFERIIEAIETNDVDYHEPRAGEIYDIGPLVLEILHPTQLGNDSNNNSISMKLTFGEVSFVMTGDAEAKSEASMLNRNVDLSAEVFSLGHHGSSTSNSESFIDAISPDVAIYSAGVGNSYGHPHDEVVALIQEKGIDLYGTDVHGTIVVKTDGRDYSVLTKKDGTISPSSTSSTKSKIDTETNEGPPPVQTGDCIDINTASIEELQNIIHIGPVRAEEIVQLRPFQSVDDLTRVNGIGPARMKDIIAENKACVSN